MLQSFNKPILPKAPESVKAPKRDEAPKLSSAEARELKNEFKKELKSASAPEAKKNEKTEEGQEAKAKNKEAESEQTGDEVKVKAASISDDAQVKAVEVSPEQALRKPSSLINALPESGNPESVTPKVFDPALTEGVQNLIQPKNAGTAPALTDEAVLKLASGEVTAAQVEAELPMKSELSQALLKNPQVSQSGEKGEAIALNPEVEQQLVNADDFMANKNMANKKLPVNHAYGMKSADMKVAMESGLKSTQVVKETAAIEAALNASAEPVNSQQFILGTMAAQESASVNETQAPVKTFDMSNIKSADADKIINQISDYIVQAKAAKEPTVNMRVNHQELGTIDITVMKAGVVNSDAVAINIGAHSMDGKAFFQQNSKDLFSHLSSAGINVADMKIETPSQTAKNDFDFNQSQKQASHDKQFGSEQNQRRHEQDRRQELWKLFNKEAA